ncbi:prolyl oligopeptidase family serine peptidase [Bdellovibrio sp. NC01]|uniref:S9 family peptidase n=1 Tax=Bdellovibrio sp. NC01 TaxID=2220073 RepID=UPI001158C75D|nr:prolyl oligopeptidase family serine peptidase [Bdellovibrio sp. NC01]QDK38622.1 S9 family peptidase [Bdellovibrio sp. NC01]
MRKLFALSAGLVLTASLANATTGYDKPPKEILDVMQAPATPFPRISPTKDRILLVSMQNYPSITRVAEPFLRLAGVRVEPSNRGRHDTPGGYGIPPCAQSFSLVKVADGSETKIDISKLACADYPRWSADGKMFFFRNKTATAVELWLGDAQTAKITRVPDVKLNQMFGSDVQWTPDQKHLLVKLVPKNQGPAPKVAETLTGPSIQESVGQKGQSSTYEKRDTLNNANDEALFDYYGVSQLAIVDVKTRKVTTFEKPDLYERLQYAPDGVHLLTKKIVRPYSYMVTYGRFPAKVEILNTANLKNVTHHLIADLPLADRVPIHGVPTSPREFTWMPHDAATLVWAEALDGGDWNVKVPTRDKIMMLAAPFKGEAKEIFRTEQRYSGFEWLEKRDNSLLYEYDENKHWIKAFIVSFDKPQQAKKVLWDLSSDEQYANPGQPIYKTLSNGYEVVIQNQNAIYLSGEGASPEGDRPFLDKLDLVTLKTDRLFRSDKTEFEQFISFLPSGKDDTFLTWYQTQMDPPNVNKRTLGEEIKAAPGEATFKSSRVAVTHISDPTPQVRDIKKRLVKYKRADGLELSFTLYTPPGYKEGTRVPTILYAYPLDYADSSKAGQITGSQNTFTRLRAYKLLLLAGYAIIDDAAFPIVGDPKKAYDNYMDQLVADAKAAVDQAVKLGVADPQRIGVTGHSHGALMTVNLLTHSNLFKAGVATSGSYNKTLTPFGFQNERRTVWEAPEVYAKVSPFFFADKMKTPLLIMHGADDANPGTTPMQASFLYDAVRANGGTVRLVMLPHEPHWYSARESNEQQISEMLKWFDKYVKNTGG